MSEAVAEKPIVPTRRTWEIGRYALLITLVAIIVITAVGNHQFFSLNNFLNILLQISVLGIVAAGQTILMISAGLDLSVGASLRFRDWPPRSRSSELVPFPLASLSGWRPEPSLGSSMACWSPRIEPLPSS